jgi:hypothetical protein
MSEKEKVSESQLKFLFDYTKFHIGMYTTLMGAVVAFLKFNAKFTAAGEPWWLRLCLVITLLCFLGAGVCGGAIASNIPDNSGLQTFRGLCGEKAYGPWNQRLAVSSLGSQRARLFGGRHLCRGRQHRCFGVSTLLSVRRFRRGREISVRRAYWPMLGIRRVSFVAWVPE